MSKLANQPISDTLMDELTDLLYEVAIRSSTPQKDIKRTIRDFLEAYIDADTVLCSVCKETKATYIRQQWMRVWKQVVMRIQQQGSAKGAYFLAESDHTGPISLFKDGEPDD